MNAMPGDEDDGRDGKAEREEDMPGALRDKFAKASSAPADYWLTVHSLQAELAQRKRRDRIFGPGTFQGDSWGLFLELVNAEFDGRKMTIGDLAGELKLSAEATERSVEHLIGRSLVRGEPGDDNEALVYSLTIEGIAMMIEYFDPRVS